MKTEIINVTDHCYERAKERLSLSKNTFLKLAQKAFDIGLKHGDTKGSLKKYLDKLWFEHKHADNVRIYGENIYIFQANNLITVYQLPNDLRKHIKYSKKL